MISIILFEVQLSSVITNDFSSSKGSFLFIKQPGWNKTRLLRTNLADPDLFVITEFYCKSKFKFYELDWKLKDLKVILPFQRSAIEF